MLEFLLNLFIILLIEIVLHDFTDNLILLLLILTHQQYLLINFSLFDIGTI